MISSNVKPLARVGCLKRIGTIPAGLKDNDHSSLSLWRFPDTAPRLADCRFQGGGPWKYNRKPYIHFQGVAMSRIVAWLLSLMVAGCGAESVGTAAIVAEQKQRELEEAQHLKDAIQQQLEAAQALEQQRLKEAEAH
jgi:hypothetical protein